MGSQQFFFSIDIFTVFVSILSLKSRKSEELFQAIKAAIPNLFKLLKCYNAISKSAEFTIFLEQLKIRFQPTFTASLWLSGAPERAVQTIKNSLRKFILQIYF